MKILMMIEKWGVGVESQYDFYVFDCKYETFSANLDFYKIHVIDDGRAKLTMYGFSGEVLFEKEITYETEGYYSPASMDGGYNYTFTLFRNDEEIVKYLDNTPYNNGMIYWSCPPSACEIIVTTPWDCYYAVYDESGMIFGQTKERYRFRVDDIADSGITFTVFHKGEYSETIILDPNNKFEKDFNDGKYRLSVFSNRLEAQRYLNQNDDKDDEPDKSWVW